MRARGGGTNEKGSREGERGRRVERGDKFGRGSGRRGAKNREGWVSGKRRKIIMWKTGFTGRRKGSLLLVLVTTI